MSASIEVKLPTQIEQIPFAIVNLESLSDYLLSNNIFPYNRRSSDRFPLYLPGFPAFPIGGYLIGDVVAIFTGSICPNG